MFELTLKGEFNRLLDFLKEIELLQPIVISDKIEIKSTLNKSDNERIKLLMSFNLTSYSRVSNNKNKLDNKTPIKTN